MSGLVVTTAASVANLAALVIASVSVTVAPHFFVGREKIHLHPSESILVIGAVAYVG
jgi:hypothetical protein